MPGNTRFLEPVFDAGPQCWPALSDNDILALESTIARQSEELNQRLTEVICLYNSQQQQANELEAACREIGRLSQALSVLQQEAARYKVDIAAAHDKVAALENEKEDLRERLEKAEQDSTALTGRLLGMEAAFKVREKNVVSAMQQVELMNSELTVTTAERFKLVAALQAERKQHRSTLHEKTSVLEGKLRRAEAGAESRERQTKRLEGDCDRLNERVEVLEALLESERQVADAKIKRLTEELQRGCT